MSRLTEKALVSNFKKMTERMPIEKITVSELCRECGIQRQTFYYHFRDIRDLVEFIYSSEMKDVLNIFFTCKDADKAVMITDSLMCKGLPAGTKFMFGGHPCHVASDGLAYLDDADGSIAGSTLHTNEGLRNLVEKAGVPFDKAIRSCTSNPAGLLGMDDVKGRICYGYDADLCVLNDDYTAAATYVSGVCRYQK